MSSKESLYNPQNEEYLKYLTKADELRQLFSGLNEDDPLKDQSPTIIVVGMQTVGKSSVLGRISGIKFPSKDELCTRCATELRMRRCTENEDPSIIVTAIFDDDRKDEIMAQNPHINDMEKVIEETQAKIVGENSISEKGKILIEVTDHDVPIITLVDLPGIYQAKDGSSAEKEYATKVRSLAETKSSHENTLILHVIDSTNDTGNDATWEIVNGADKEKIRRITVATKVDLQQSATHLLKAGKDCGGKIFGIIGNAVDEEEEKEKLSKVRNSLEKSLVDPKTIEFGLGSLKSFLENRMSIFLQEKIPELREKIMDSLKIADRDLSKIGDSPKLPLSVALKQIEDTNQNLTSMYGDIQKKLKKRIEDFVMKFKSCGDEIDWFGVSMMCEVFDHLDGKIRPAPFQENYGILKNFLKTMTQEVEKIADDFITSSSKLLLKEYFMKAIKSRDPMCKHAQSMFVEADVVTNFKKVEEKCRDRVKEALEWNLLEDVYSTNHHYFKDLMDKKRRDLNEFPKPDMEKICGRFRNYLPIHIWNEHINDQEDKNDDNGSANGSDGSVSNGDGSANEGESENEEDQKNTNMDDEFKKRCVEIAKEYENQAIETIIGIQAYWKVQRKLIVDVIQNYVRQILLYQGRNSVKESQKKITTCLEHIKEPKSIQDIRNDLLNRKHIYQKALEILDRV